jgi:hypothetical protein
MFLCRTALRRALTTALIVIGWSNFMSIAADEPQAPAMYKGTETLKYTVVTTLADDIEIRSYAAAVKVVAQANGENNAFGQLFRYISGANSVNTSIAMTAPVETASVKVAMTTPVEMTMAKPDGSDLSDHAENKQTPMQMSFFLPSMYDYQTAPKPTSPDLSLVAVPARMVAVIRFSGLRSESKLAQKTQRLKEALAQTPYKIISEPVMMGYDAPWTLWFNRRNEVMFEVK